MTADARTVFVVHGRNKAARDSLFLFLRALALHPLEWEQAIALTGEGSPYIGDVLDKAFSEAQAVVVLLSPDDISYLRSEFADGDEDPEGQPAAQARPNVLFEAGMAMGRNADRTVLVEFGKVRPFTDIVGRHAVRLDNSPAKRRALAQRLRTAGCDVNDSGTDWLEAGDLTPPVPPGGGLPLGKRIPASHHGGVAFDALYHDRGRGSGRLQIVNRGTEPVFDLNIELPPEGSDLHLIGNDLPVKKLPPGKSATLPAARHWGGGKSHFEIRVTGKTSEGVAVDESVFLDLMS